MSDFLLQNQDRVELALTRSITALLAAEPEAPLEFLKRNLLLASNANSAPPVASKRPLYLDRHPEIEEAIVFALTALFKAEPSSDPLEYLCAQLAAWKSPKPSGAPVRLLIASRIGSLHPIPCFEAVPADAYEEVSFEEFMATKRHSTGVISWRWARAKPPSFEAAQTEDGRQLVPLSLVRHCETLVKQDPGTEYIWLDWACVPQYASDPSLTMAEINRSGSYYSSSRRMITWCFTQLDEEKRSLTYSTYFTRAWTLSERLHRMNGEYPLTLAAFVPVYLQPGSGSCILDAAPATAANSLIGDANGEMKMMLWHSTLRQIIAKAGELQKQQDEEQSVSLLDSIMRLVLSRYPRLLQVDTIVSEQLLTLGDPVTALLLRIAVLLRAFSEWLRPCPDEEGLYRMKAAIIFEMYDEPPGNKLFPWSLKVGLLSSWLQNW